MGFFDDLPAPEPAPPRRHHPWEPPEAEFPSIVPIDTLLLGRTDQVAVAVTGLSAFSAGIETAQSVFERFPGIKDPYETVLAEVAKAGRLLTKHGLAAVGEDPVAGC